MASPRSIMMVVTVHLVLFWVPEITGRRCTLNRSHPDFWNCTTVTTFNTGLTTKVRNYWSRRALIPDALAAEGSDVFCLQELWYEDDMRNVIDKLKGTYRYHHSGIHSRLNKLENDTPTAIPRSACGSSDVYNLMKYFIPCALSNGCDELARNSSSRGLICLTLFCSDLLRNKSLSPSCVSCLVLSSSSTADAANRCFQAAGGDNRFNPSGLLLLSKKIITRSTYVPYFFNRTQILHRGYIQAEIQDIGKFVCTHNSASFPLYFEYDLNFTSYAQQKLTEIGLIVSRLRNYDHILAGDLNTGPTISNARFVERNLQGVDTDSYQELRDARYDVDAYFQYRDARCTYCMDNPIYGKTNKVVDHVLVKGRAFDAVYKRRTFDRSHPVLSDHYGVRATLCDYKGS